jgi:DNA repair protein RadC
VPSAQRQRRDLCAQSLRGCRTQCPDHAITHDLRDALQLVGVRVLDHLVIGSGEPVSMAARGLL